MHKLTSRQKRRLDRLAQGDESLRFMKGLLSALGLAACCYLLAFFILTLIPWIIATK